MIDIFFENYTVQLRRPQHACTLIPINTRTQILPLWAPPKHWVSRSRDLQSHDRHLGVDGDVAYHWNHSTVKSWKNPGKCEHPCQVENLNPGGQVPPEGTQPTDLWLVRGWWLIYVFTGWWSPPSIWSDSWGWGRLCGLLMGWIHYEGWNKLYYWPGCTTNLQRYFQFLLCICYWNWQCYNTTGY
jgi:hypothetical protein